MKLLKVLVALPLCYGLIAAPAQANDDWDSADEAQMADENPSQGQSVVDDAPKSKPKKAMAKAKKKKHKAKHKNRKRVKKNKKKKDQ